MKKLFLNTLLLLLTLGAFSQSSYKVNTYYAELGGYVIEVNADGTDGLVVAMQDQGNGDWCEVNRLLNNASNHDSAGANFKDWRIPTKRELKIMYNVYMNVNGANLNANSYWSSTTVEPDGAWRQDFSDGNQATSYMSNKRSLRAIRSF